MSLKKSFDNDEVHLFMCIERGERGGKKAKEERKKVKKTILCATSYMLCMYFYLKSNGIFI